MPSLQALLDSGVPLSKPRVIFEDPAISTRTSVSWSPYIGWESGEPRHGFISYSFEVSEEVADFLESRFEDFVESYFDSSTCSTSNLGGLYFFKNAMGNIAANYVREFDSSRGVTHRDEVFLNYMMHEIPGVLREEQTPWTATVIPPLKLTREGIPDQPSSVYVPEGASAIQQIDMYDIPSYRARRVESYIAVSLTTSHYASMPKPYEYCWSSGVRRAAHTPTKIMLFRSPPCRRGLYDEVCSGKFVAVLTPESILLNPSCKEFAEISERSSFMQGRAFAIRPNRQIDIEILPRPWRRTFSLWRDSLSSGGHAMTSPIPFGPSNDQAAVSQMPARR